MGFTDNLGLFEVPLNTAGLSAARLIVVDADNDEAVLGFYRKLGFEVSLWAEEMAKNHTKKRTQPATIKMHRDVFKDL